MTDHDSPDTAVRRDFIEKMGLQVESLGWMPRMTGRVLGCLLVSDGPVTQSELREQLDASLGSVSASCQVLLRKRLAQRVNIPGSRQAGIQLHVDAWRSLEEDGLQSVQDYASLADCALRDLGTTDSVSARNLERMSAYFAAVEERMRGVLGWLDSTKPGR
jgi:DNA-binding transcriptional regulator GbsR (MarR family)